MYCPAALAGVGDPTLDPLQLAPLGAEGARGKLKEPAADDRALHPEVAHLGEVELVARLREDFESFGVRLHHSVLDAVVHHLYVVAGPGAAAVHVAILWRKRDKDWLERLHRCVVAADHHAVAVLQAPHAARGSGVDEVNAVTGKLLVSADGVVEVGVAAINDGVALGEEGDQFVDHCLGRIAAWHHDPDALWGGQAVDQLLHGVGRLGTLLGDLVGLLAGAVPNHHVVAVADQSLHHVGAHLAEADKSDLHDLPLQLIAVLTYRC